MMPDEVDRSRIFQRIDPVAEFDERRLLDATGFCYGGSQQ
jgi:hypothetical protein